MIISAFIVKSSDIILFRHCILLGIIMLCVIPISIHDDRKEMRGNLYTVMTLIGGLVLSIFSAIAASSWWIVLLYFVETTASVAVIKLLRYRHRKKYLKNSKKKI